MALTVTSIGSATGKGVTQVQVTLGSNLPSGVTLFVAIAVAGSTVPNISDSFGQTHWVGGNGLSTANATVLLDWCWNTSAMNAGNTITVSPSSGTFTCSIYAWYVTGLLTTASPVDVAQTGSGSGTSPSLTTGTLAQGSEYCVGTIAVAGPSSETFTSDTNFPLQSYRAGTTGGSDITVDVDMRSVSSTSAVTWAPTLGTSENYAAYLATFKVVDVSVNLTGAAATGSAGTLVSQDSLGLTGVAGTSAAQGLGGGSFTRASNATFIDAGGIVRNVGNNVMRFQSGVPLIEPATTNQISQSVNLTLGGGANWASNASPNDATVTANATTAPDGTLTAYAIIPGTGLGSHGIFRAHSGGATNTTYTASCYIKAAGYNYTNFGLGNTAYPTTSVTFRLDTGTIFSTTGTCTGTITAVGNTGWYLCTHTVTSNGTGGNYICSFQVHNNSNTTNYNGDGVSGIYAWGVQVEIGSTATSLVYPYTAGATGSRSADTVSTTGIEVVAPNLTGAQSATAAGTYVDTDRSEERRVGKECRSRWSPYH